MFAKSTFFPLILAIFLHLEENNEKMEFFRTKFEQIFTRITRKWTSTSLVENKKEI